LNYKLKKVLTLSKSTGRMNINYTKKHKKFIMLWRKKDTFYYP